MVFASTSEVFGKNPNPPWAEDDDRVLGSTKTARWSYSTSKGMAEHLVFAMHAAHGLPVTVVRYFNVYGPRQNPIFVISQTVHRILNGRQPLLYDSGDQTRCFTYVDDAVAGTLLAAESNAAIGEAFNIGSMTETTMRDAVDLAIKIANVDNVSTAEVVDTAARIWGSVRRHSPSHPRLDQGAAGAGLAPAGRRRGRDPPHHRVGAGQSVVPRRIGQHHRSPYGDPAE